MNIYLNGVNVFKTAPFYIQDLPNDTSPFYIGGRIFDAATNVLYGYINNFRVVQGYALYNKDFVPPTGNLSAIPATTFLFQHPYSSYKVLTAVEAPVGLAILSGTNSNPVSISNAYIKNLPIPISMDSTRFEQFYLESSILSSNIGIDIQFKNTNNLLEGSYTFHKNIFDETDVLDNISLYQTDSYNETGLSFMSHNELSGNHFKYKKSGKISIDKTFGYTATKISEKLEPYAYSSIIPLRSSVKQVPVSLGEIPSISVYIFKSSTPNYDGPPPRLILKQNASIGYSYTVLATSTSPNGIWEKLLGVLPQTLADGIFEVYVECSGSAGYVSIDSWDF
jgi:hypothetical protein